MMAPTRHRLVGLLLVASAACRPRIEPRRPPSRPAIHGGGAALLSLRPSALLIDAERRGADQRQPWVRAVAAVHPVWRTGAVLTVVAMLCALVWIREINEGQCTAWQLGALVVCRALLQLGLVAAGVLAIAVVIVVTNYLSRLEELRDADLSLEDLAAAASCAAYAGEHATSAHEMELQRLAELRERGVLSANWRVDRRLSTPTAAVFVNWHTQAVLVAFRGSVTLGDWASNAKSIVPGDLANSRSFRAGLDVARRAQRKYVLFRSIRLTGHSRGGSMADYVGRTLGLPSLQINPGSWGKLFRTEDPAVESLTARTADLVSLLEAVVSRDRQVRLVWPKRQKREFAVACALALLFALLAAFGPEAWLRAAGLAGCVAGVVMYIVWMHSVLRFTRS